MCRRGAKKLVTVPILGGARKLVTVPILWCSLAAAGDLPPITDPTAPPDTVAPAAQHGASSFLLYSTHVAASSRSAVINNQVVAIGSRIDGAVVTSIEKGQVSLSRGSETIVLRLLLLPVKRPAKDAG